MFKTDRLLLTLVLVFAIAVPVLAQEKSEIKYGNSWVTEEGETYFTCPVMRNEGKIANAEGYSDIDGLRYVHCCPPCQGPFRANPEKYLSDLAYPANIVKIDEDGNKHFRDPVNGKVKKVKEKTRFSDYENGRYFFSSKKSKKKFEESPEEFVKK